MEPGSFLDFFATTDTQFFRIWRLTVQCMAMTRGLGSREFYDGDSQLYHDGKLWFRGGNTLRDIRFVTPGWLPLHRLIPHFSQQLGVIAETEDLEEDWAEIKKDRSTIIIHYEDWRDGTLNDMAWTQLDAFINGPDWSPTSRRVWGSNLPIVRPIWLAYSARFWDLSSQRRCEDDQTLMHQLRWDIHQLASTWLDPCRSKYCSGRVHVDGQLLFRSILEWLQQQTAPTCRGCKSLSMWLPPSWALRFWWM